MNDRARSASVQAAVGRNHVAVSGHQAATDAALDVMDAGGNVVDAAIAAAAVLCAALPHACGLGGDCFALLHYEGKTLALNGSGRSPRCLPRDVPAERLASGALSCSVPGMLGGWEALHSLHGSLPWSALFDPAINLARHGVNISSDLDKALEAHRESLEADPGCRRLFSYTSSRANTGRLLAQPALADTLEVVAGQGAKAFYGGEIGQHVCRVVNERGGVLSIEDLTDYEPVWSTPSRYRYRDLDICVPPPNSYALLLLLQLASLSSVQLERYAYGSASRLEFLMHAARSAIAQGASLLADPELLATKYPQLPPPALVRWMESSPLDKRIENGSTHGLPPSHGTALISIADKQGNGVTIIQSIFTPFGSYVGDDVTGVILNNRLLGFSANSTDVNAAAPAKRPAHTLSPALALENGRLRYLLSTPGGSGQTITLAQVLTSMADYGLSLEEAISNPRWSLDLQGNLLAEPEISAGVVDALRHSGLPVITAEPRHRFFFGSAECIHIGEKMELKAVADYRRNATAGGR